LKTLFIDLKEIPLDNSVEIAEGKSRISPLPGTKLISKTIQETPPKI
jgi:hypothetical protein